MNPYKIEGPALISFSGGRTSAYMLYHILQAHGGKLPKDLYVIFANTGKECPETLDFVKDCQEKWGVSIVWLEFDWVGGDEQITKTVNYETASRNGEPFTKMIEYFKTRTELNTPGKYEKNHAMLPNPVARFCTDKLKIVRINDYMKQQGIKIYDTVLGLRYDEPRRVAKQKAKNTQKKFNLTPLYEAKATKEDVNNFWRKQNFDLNLPIIDNETPHGNCDLCFLKSHKKISQIIKEDKSKAIWWAETEEKFNNRFRADRPSYRELITLVDIQQEFPFDDDNMDCFCHD